MVSCVGFIVLCSAEAVLISVVCLVRGRAHLVVERMRAVIYPLLLPLSGAETHTSRGDEKSVLKDLKAEKMETIESWWMNVL